MKKIISIFPYILLIFAIGIISYQQNLIKENKILLSKYKTQDSTFLSMMIENEDGDYKESTNNEWPGEGYILNTERSGCENGGALEYQDNNVYVKAKTSDRCYVYFDLDNIGNRCRGKELASCLIANKASDTNLIYHDGNSSDSNSNLEAGDLSYRYSGADPNNYVCFGGDCSNDPNNTNYKNLYRIIGLFKNNDGKYETKIIKADTSTKENLGESTTAGSAYKATISPDAQYYKGQLKNYAVYYWNSTDSAHLTYETGTNTNMWKDSNLNKVNLNQIYYSGLDQKYRNMIIEHTWQVGGYSVNTNAKLTYDYELGDKIITNSHNYCYTQDGSIIKNQTPRQCNQTNDLTYKANVGLMYISDYMYATLPEYWDTIAENYSQNDVKNNDWLYLGLTEWTISRNCSSDLIVRNVLNTGRAHYTNSLYFYCGIRPVVYLSYNVKITGGTGTKTDPYKIAM